MASDHDSDGHTNKVGRAYAGTIGRSAFIYFTIEIINNTCHGKYLFRNVLPRDYDDLPSLVIIVVIWQSNNVHIGNESGFLDEVNLFVINL